LNGGIFFDLIYPHSTRLNLLLYQPWVDLPDETPVEMLPLTLFIPA